MITYTNSTTTEAAAEETPPLPQLHKLNNLKTHMAALPEHVFDNIKKAMVRDLPWIKNYPGFKVKKDKNLKIALVGGGDSVKTQLDTLRSFDGIVIACGSSHDWLVDNGINPTWCVICDPDPIAAEYVTKPVQSCTYFIASQCDDAVFDKLKSVTNKWLWHCYNEHYDELKAIDSTFEAIGGGCTVGLRALSMVVLMGYSNIHFFGFDSCLGENDKHHVYNFATDKEELGDIYDVYVGMESSRKGVNPNIQPKRYRAAGYMLAQVQHFRDFYSAYNELFEPTFYGDGLMQAMFKMIGDEVMILKGKLQ